MSKLTKFSDLKKIPCESSWFEPYKVAEGVTAIYEPHHFQEVISYLIEGEEKALLLDSGMGLGNIKAVVEFLTDKPITLVNSHLTRTIDFYPFDALHDAMAVDGMALFYIQKDRVDRILASIP